MTIVLAALFAVMSTGGLSFLHEREHHHARPASWAPAVQESDDHDEATCPICTTLHMPLLPAGYVPLLICLGLLAAFLSVIGPSLSSQRVPLVLVCRGPPAL
jgi:hypothetical protein